MNPSEWIVRWTHLLAPGSTVLDVACGSGRHLRWFAQAGHKVLGVDRDVSGAQHLAAQVTLVQADIENSHWPLMTEGLPQKFDAVVVTNYLWRPLLPILLASVAPGGTLLYETFAIGNAAYGRPSRADFLLQAGELWEACQGLDIVAYENGMRDNPPRCVQRIAAKRPPLYTSEVTPQIVHAL
ncbi:MAG: SAM-dependent methyltransferase [Burkholderiales bacterium PBB3]|nr:MAG: SAM-dependent methyltransferase [Burkholderiales bacterium PBB3]